MENSTGNNTTTTSACEGPTAVVVLTVTYIVFGISALVGNLAVIISVVRYRQLRSVPNILICNLSLSGAVSSLFILLAEVPKPSDADVISKHKCQIRVIIGLIIVISSVYNLVLMSIERFIAIISPLIHLKMVTKTRIRYIVILSWLMYVVVAVCSSFMWENKKQDDVDVFYCAKNVISHSFIIVMCSLVIFGMSLNIVLFIIVVIFVYKKTRIGEELYKRRYPKPQTTRIVFVTFFSFAICWIPYIGVLIYKSFYPETNYPGCLSIVSKLFGLFYSSFNWVIYGIMAERFRLAIVSLLTCKNNSKFILYQSATQTPNVSTHQDTCL